MDYATSQRLKEAWGNKPCDHPMLEKVYYTGAYLINYSCTACGADFTISQKLEMDEKREDAKKSQNISDRSVKYT